MFSLMSESCRHVDVCAADLDVVVRKVIAVNSANVRQEHVAVLKVLFQNGASTMLRGSFVWLFVCCVI
jgi:hypothetical protein